MVTGEQKFYPKFIYMYNMYVNLFGLDEATSQ